MEKERIKNLPENINNMRLNSGLTLEIVAKKLGLKGGKTTFHAYETGKAEPSLATIVKISDLFKTDLDKILRGKIKINKQPIFNKCVKCGEDVKSKTGKPIGSNYCNECYWN